MQNKSLIDGLLAKRADLQREGMDLRQRVAVLTNDLAAFERVLEACGYRGTLSAAKPVQARMILFQRDEMRTYIMDVLRKAERPLTAREIAEAVRYRGARKRRSEASQLRRVEGRREPS